MKAVKVSELQATPFSTGFPTLDVALEGGFPIGKMTELFGASSSGKTTFALQFARHFAEIDKRKILFIDAEGVIGSKAIMRIVGEKCADRMRILETQVLEEVAEYCKENHDYGLIILDSIGALTVNVDSNAHGDANMGKMPSLLGKFFRVFSKIRKENNIIMLNINQMRDKIGGFGEPWYTPGGNAVKFFHSVRIKISGARAIHNGIRKMNFLIYKNQSGKMGHYVDMAFHAEKGIYLPDASVLDFLIEHDVIKVSSGGVHKKGNKIIARSRAAAIENVANIPDKSVDGLMKYASKDIH